MSMTRLLWRLNVPQVHKVPKPAHRYECNVHPQFSVRFVCPLNVIRMSICNFAINKRIKSQLIQKRFRQLSFIIKCMIEAKKKNTHTLGNVKYLKRHVHTRPSKPSMTGRSEWRQCASKLGDPFPWVVNGTQHMLMIVVPCLDAINDL